MKLRRSMEMESTEQIDQGKEDQIQVEVREKDKTKEFKNEMDVKNMFRILMIRMKEDKRDMREDREKYKR